MATAIPITPNGTEVAIPMIASFDKPPLLLFEFVLDGSTNQSGHRDQEPVAPATFETEVTVT